LVVQEQQWLRHVYTALPTDVPGNVQDTAKAIGQYKAALHAKNPVKDDIANEDIFKATLALWRQLRVHSCPCPCILKLLKAMLQLLLYSKLEDVKPPVLCLLLVVLPTQVVQRVHVNIRLRCSKPVSCPAEDAVDRIQSHGPGRRTL
jgi:hypothetical protein